MGSIFTSALIALVLIYIIVGVLYLEKRINKKYIQDMIEKNAAMSGTVGIHSNTKDRVSTIRTMAWEDYILKKMGIKPSQAIMFLYLERFILAFVFILLMIFMKGLGLALVLAIIINFVFEDMYKKMIYNSGVTNIPRLSSFINFFVPQLDSGISADQALAVYIQTNADEELAEFYKNKDNEDYKVPVHLKQIIDVYDLAVYNERLGANEYTYILMEQSEDINQKSSYYNKFLGAMGEIKPIGYSFIFGVPIFIIISYEQTREFWQGTFGWVAGLAIVLLFALYKFLIFKLQEKTVKKIF